ncbi:MAG TPA: hypothetical protein VF473_05065, partial [Cyclobacteriaceae bacterium]
QDLSLTANKLKVTNNPAATEINLAPYLDNTDSQTLALNAKQLSVSGGNILDVTPFFDNTDAQTLGLNSNKLSITGGNEVDLTPYLDNTDAQSLSLTTSGTTRTVAISGGNSIAIDVADNDNSPTNEIQDLSLNGNTLSLSSDATTVNLLPYLDNTDSQNLGNVLTQGNDAGAQKITNLGTPAANADAATKKYVDDADAVINARISANYAFKATYSYTQGVGPGNDISFSLTPSFDDFGVLGSSTFTAAVTGTYLFILDGSASNVPAPVFSLLSNGTKYPVAMGSNGRYNATFMLKLTAGQTVSLVGDNLGSNYSINGSFYGYKLL